MTHNRQNKSAIGVVIPFVIIAIVFGVSIFKRYQDSRQACPVPSMHESAGTPSAVLFFVHDGSRLARESRVIDYCEADTACLKEVLRELLSGPVGDFETAIPDGVVLNSVKIQGNLAVIDLNVNFSTGLPSGSSAEMMAVYALVNTVCLNFGNVSRVKLNIDGDARAVLNHLDLTDPIEADFSLEQSPTRADACSGDMAAGQTILKISDREHK